MPNQAPNYIDSKEVAPGEYQDSLFFLKDDLKIIKRTMLLAIKHVETKESEKYKLRYCLKEDVEQLIGCFYSQDLEGLLRLTNTDEDNSYATKLVCRFVPSGKYVCIQVYQDRPHEDGRSVRLTPARVFQDAGTSLLDFAKRM